MLNCACVRLQRSLPVSRSFLPSLLFFSSNKTRAPLRLACPAVIMPDGPPPITITSKVGFIFTQIVILNTFAPLSANSAKDLCRSFFLELDRDSSLLHRYRLR